MVSSSRSHNVAEPTNSLDPAITRLCSMATSMVNSHSTLAAAAYSFVGQPYTPPDGTVEGGGKSTIVRDHALSTLQLFTELVEANQTAAAFAKFLNREQSTSWRLIHEWISGDTQSAISKDWAKQAIESDTFNPVDLWDWVLRFRSGLGTLRVSYYQYYLLVLFKMEFTSDVAGAEPSDDWMESLATARRDAQNYATSQRLAYALFSRSELAEGPKSFHPPMPLMEDVCPWLINSSDENEYPFSLWDTKYNATIQSADINSQIHYSCISHTWGRWRSSKSIRLPNVLWEIPCNTLFNVRNLPLFLRQCAERLGCRYIWFDLVCIPQEFGDTELGNRARLEISRQSLIFRNANSCVAWMNYIDDWKAERKTLDFISQLYLKHSAPADHYPEDRITFGSKSGAQERLQLLTHPDHEKYFQTRRFRSDMQSAISTARQKVPDLRMIFKDSRERAEHHRRADFESARRRNEIRDLQWKPSPWFSSLWTLQEAYLRPDMVLYNRSWEPLADSAGSIFTLEMLWTIMNTIELLMADSRTQENWLSQLDPEAEEVEWQIWDNMRSSRRLDGSLFSINNLPLGVQQLHALCEPMSTIRKAGPSRAHILAQSHSRQCSDQRAPGIMAVLGLSDWQIPKVPPKEEELVLGMYPMDFVDAAMRKTGPAFFLARKSTELGSRPEDEVTARRKPVTGSMLPFGRFNQATLRGLDKVKMTALGSTDTEFHPSVLHWTLNICGSFIVRHAAILASNDGIQRRRHDVSAAWFSIIGGVYSAEAGDITNWVTTQSQRFRTVAINVSRTCGVFLQAREPDKYPMELTKVGCYVLHGGQWLDEAPIDWLPTSTRINWVII